MPSVSGGMTHYLEQRGGEGGEKRTITIIHLNDGGCNGESTDQEHLDRKEDDGSTGSEYKNDEDGCVHIDALFSPRELGRRRNLVQGELGILTSIHDKGKSPLSVAKADALSGE